MRKIALFCSLFILYVLHPLAAQENDSLIVNLSELQVTAAQKKLYSEMGRILTVIDKTEIKSAAVQSIDQLLDYVAGIDIRQRGTNSTQADISVRGGTFDQVLVLLNGVNITDPQTGHFNLDIPVNISDISRIEILEGSAARVLGPNAFSGAINIVTEVSDKQSLKAELTGGSFMTLGQGLSSNFSLNSIHSFASASHFSSDGYMANTNFNILNGFVQSVLNTGDYGKFELQLSAQTKDMGENGFYSLKFPNQREATKTFFSALDWSLIKGNFAYNAQISWRNHNDRYELDHNSPAGFKYHLTDVITGKLNGSYVSKIGKTTLGISLRNEHIFSTALGTPMTSPDSLAAPFENNIFFKNSYNRLVCSAMIDHSLKLNNWYLSGGIATSYSQDFKFTTYGGLDLAYFISDDTKLFASANTATRLPTFTDLFFVNTVQQGNPTLNPETSETYEIGIKSNKTNWNFNVDVYYRMGQNVIDWVKLTSTSPKYEAMNLSKVNALGGDITCEYIFHQSFLKKISASYSYLSLDKKIEGVDSKYALDYLKHKISLSVNHSIFSKLSASWKIGYYDRAGSYDANTVLGSPSIIKSYSPYALLDTRFLWADKTFDVFLDVNNILNSNYADYGGLTQSGINFNVGVRKRL
ncbi:MAG: TonB-dependent receptor [Paludibacter sp.]